VKRHWAWLRPALRQPKVLLAFTASALLLSANWLTYIWSVTHGHVIDASLGYFITPLVNVLLGYTVLKERLRPAQWAAVGLAAAGVMWLAMQGGQFPWIALVLACTFGGYGLMRKTATLGALEGLALETMLLAPPALAMLAFSAARGESSFPADSALVNAMLIGIGPVTAIPLLLFAAGARRIRMSTLGILQYIGPTIQFGLGVWLFNEPFAGPRIVGFLLIWAALVIYSMEGLLQTSAVQRTVLEPD
jgi:chloramphenicol-sensitive protein RarD